MLLGSRRIWIVSLASSAAKRRPRSACPAVSRAHAAAFSPASEASTRWMKASSSDGAGMILGRGPRFQLVGRAERDGLAAIDQGDAVAIFGLVHEMGGDEDGDALADEAVDMRPEFAPGDRIDARGRLVEEQGVGLVHHRAGEREALLEAERQVLGVGVQIVLEVERLDHRRDLVALARAAEPIDAGEEFQILPDAEIAIEREFLRHVAEPVARVRRGAAQVEAGDAALAAGRLEQAAQHFEGGGLARAVRAEQAEDLARREC